MARPTKLNKEIQDAICEAIENGATYSAAAEAAGIAVSTMNDWLKDERPRFVQFSEAVRAANARFMTDALRKIREAGRKDWRALAWSLERRLPELFGQKTNVDLTSKGERIDFDYGKLIAGITPRPAADNHSPSQNQDNQHGQTVGQNDDGGDTGD